MQVARLVASTHGRRLPFEVRPGEVATLGRSSECTVPIDDTKVSRRHCLVRLAGQQLLVEDLDSGNGVKYRGLRVAQAELRPGDGFHIGYTFVQFEGWRTAPDAPPTSAATSAAEQETADDLEIATVAAALDAAADAAAAVPAAPNAPATPAPAPSPAFAAAARESDYADVASPRTPTRRQPSQQKRLAARLLAELIVFTTIWAVGIALLLVLKVMSPSCDIYRLLDWLRSLRG
jgi:hypothetical protein